MRYLLFLQGLVLIIEGVLKHRSPSEALILASLGVLSMAASRIIQLLEDTTQ